MASGLIEIYCKVEFLCSTEIVRKSDLELGIEAIVAAQMGIENISSYKNVTEPNWLGYLLPILVIGAIIYFIYRIVGKGSKPIPAIAGPVSGAAQERPAQNPSPTRNPVSPLSQTASHTATSNEQPSHSDQAKTLDWETLLKYDPDVTKAVEKLQAHGDPAVEEFKEAYEAVGGDRTVINHITDVIIKDWEQKKLDRQKEEIALAEEMRKKEIQLSEEKKKKTMKEQQRKDMTAKVLKALSKGENDKLDMLVKILDLQLTNRNDDQTYVKIEMYRGFTINYSSEKDEMVLNIVKGLNDDELDRLATALE